MSDLTLEQAAENYKQAMQKVRFAEKQLELCEENVRTIEGTLKQLNDEAHTALRALKLAAISYTPTT